MRKSLTVVIPQARVFPLRKGAIAAAKRIRQVLEEEDKWTVQADLLLISWTELLLVTRLRLLLSIEFCNIILFASHNETGGECQREKAWLLRVWRDVVREWRKLRKPVLSGKTGRETWNETERSWEGEWEGELWEEKHVARQVHELYKPFYFVWVTIVVNSLQQNWWPCQDLCSEEDEFWLWEPTNAGINLKRNQTKHQHVENDGWSQGITRQDRKYLKERTSRRQLKDMAAP